MVIGVVFAAVALLPGVVTGMARGFGRRHAVAAVAGGAVVLCEAVALTAMLAGGVNEDFGGRGEVLVVLLAATFGALTVLLALWFSDLLFD